jgi:EmrB/QacA subfamily drug resistance transporter
MSHNVSTRDLPVRLSSPRGRWVLAATVLASGVAFLDGTVVNVALPSIGRSLHVGVSGLQWVLDGYLLTMGSLIVLGGSLGDLRGRRRIFVIGLLGFMVTSAACAFAPSAPALVLARVAQGVAAALLVPGSLAIIAASFHPDDRPRAIGAWSGLAGVWTALGPFLGGWLVDSVSWRLVFLINVPLVLVAVFITMRHVPESRDEEASGHLDVPGATALTLGLAGVVYALIDGPSRHWPVLTVAGGVAGLAFLAVFFVIERRVPEPMLPLGMFRSLQFSGANATTFAVYAALGISTFLVVVNLQDNAGYSALQAGASLLPMTVLMFLFSARAAALAQRIGPRVPMTVGPIVAGIGLAMLATVDGRAGYVTGVLPGVLVLGAGMTITVAPLTAAVLAAAEERHAALASAINNAVARLGSLLAIAIIPSVAGMTGGARSAFARGYPTAMRIAACVAAAGGVVAWATIRRGATVAPVPHADLSQACHSSSLSEEVSGGGR